MDISYWKPSLKRTTSSGLIVTGTQLEETAMTKGITKMERTTNITNMTNMTNMTNDQSREKTDTNRRKQTKPPLLAAIINGIRTHDSILKEFSGPRPMFCTNNVLNTQTSSVTKMDTKRDFFKCCIHQIIHFKMGFEPMTP